MHRKSFSIIIPIYNVEKYLAGCLESILSQSYQNYEIICVNDASTDNSLEILSHYSKKTNRIKIINNEGNEGLSVSRNKALKIAQGEYILFVDSDDYILKDALQILDKALQENPVDVLNFNYDLKVESAYEKERNPIRLEIHRQDISLKSGQRWFADAFHNGSLITMAWSRAYRKEFLVQEQLWFYERLIHEDVLFLIQIAVKAKTVMCIEDRLYTYRKREGSITTIKSKERLDSLIVILSETLAILRDRSLEEGMGMALYQYVSDIWLPLIRTLMMYFPEHKELTIGNPEDQFLFSILRYMEGRQTYQYVNLNTEEWNMIGSFDKRIIFGAGNVASELLCCFQNRGLGVFAVAVSDRDINTAQIAGYTIQQIDGLAEYSKDALVIIAVVKRNQEPVRKKLMGLGFENIFSLDTDRAKMEGGSIEKRYFR